MQRLLMLPKASRSSLIRPTSASSTPIASRPRSIAHAQKLQQFVGLRPQGYRQRDDRAFSVLLQEDGWLPSNCFLFRKSMRCDRTDARDGRKLRF